MTRSKHAFVTGAAGFIGSHLVEALLDQGWTVQGLDSLSPFNGEERKRENLARLEARDGFECEVADLREAALDPLLEGSDAVFHLAALPGVRTSWGEAFRDYTSINVEATARLLEACVREEISRVVYASSSSVYGNAQRFPAHEDDPTAPISPYGVTKLAGEHLARLFATNFDLFTVSLRFFTVYGPRQRPDMAFQRFVEGVLTGEERTIFGDGGQTRDFTYVSDAVQSLVGALDAPRAGAVYNVGGGSRTTLSRVIEIIESHAGKKGVWTHAASEAGDPRHTGADTSKARDEIGYAPRVPLEDGLLEQVQWMERRLSREPA